MRSMRLRRVVLWMAFVAVMILGVAGGGPAAADDDCETWCVDGYFNYAYLKCVPSFPQDCTHCQVTCPGGGGGGFEPENQG